MGAYSELDMELRESSDAFEEDDSFYDGEGSCTEPHEPVEVAAQVETAPQANEKPASTPAPSPELADKAAAEDAKRKAHEEAEAKRKAEWEARQAAKKAAEQEQLAKLEAMADDELMAASLKRVGEDTEKLTRRSMKECVAEHIQTLCLGDPAFARKVMHPRKSMIHCIWYINRKAREFIEKEIKDNDFPKENGIYGGDVPDGLCYQWAVDYFNDPEAEEDHEDEEKFVPKPYYGGSASKTKPKEKAKKEQPKKAPSKPAPQEPANEQMSLLGVA